MEMFQKKLKEFFSPRTGALIFNLIIFLILVLPSVVQSQTPYPGHWTGTTSRDHPMSFDVSSNSSQWSNFKLKTDFSFTGVWGTTEITVFGPGTISNGQFSRYGSEFSFSCQFASSSTATGTYAFTNYRIIVGIPYPPYIKSYYLNQSGTWSATKPPPEPFGQFDTPSDGSIVSGSIPVTGWALDDVEVEKVEIKRDPDVDDPAAAIGADGLVWIGNGIFVKGARTDIENLYPNYPNNDRAGWGYMLLTYGLPRKGNGTFKLHAIAEDSSGNRILLGTKTITSDNNNRVKPFGTIDTPLQGGVVSGSAYVNFGWALTPPPKMIPTDGSTMRVYINSVLVDNPTYNQYRADLANDYPTYLNKDGAAGYLYIDTTQYEDGVHTIGWEATDDQGQADGMGSRFFEIQNLGASSMSVAEMEHTRYVEDMSGKLCIDVEGEREIEIEELGRIELKLKGEGGIRYIGWGENMSKALPIGSTLDKERGIFYWMPGPGFLKKHILHFAVTDGLYMSKPVKITVNIVPKKYIKRDKRKKIIK